ncbi:MAG: hypothetical protein ACREC6_08640 [Hyphomicrobiaceae bacterium]
MKILGSQNLSHPTPPAGRKQQGDGRGLKLLAAGLILAAGTAVMAAEAEPPKLQTNEEYIESLARETTLDLDNPMAVFEFVFSSLRSRVKVYPTENYYYFSFVHNNLTYAGNLRFDPVERDRGNLHFAYSLESTLWRGTQELTYRLLTAQDGVKVEKRDVLSYRVSYKNKEVIFDLNDLSQVRPPDGMLNPGEIYIGPVFDESGLQFFLIFNPLLRVFHYLLNEAGRVPEVFYQSKVSPRIIIGNRTSYAFYKDKKIDRKILIGVHEINTILNNHFDGPFDQLPDNFIQGDMLRDAIVAVLPDYRGKIDRFGALPGTGERYAISPYMYYDSEQALALFEDCVTKEEIPYYACFHFEPPGETADTGGNRQGNGGGKKDADTKGRGVPPGTAR